MANSIPANSLTLPDARPLATIVIVNYNYERFIAAAIDSALENLTHRWR